MNVEAVEIHLGDPHFQYTLVRQIRARAEARSVFSGSPTDGDVNMQLRRLAAGVGADAVVNVEYTRGMSLTSWQSLTATGLAVRRVKDDVACPVCAETVKRAAHKCKHCGASLTPPRLETSGVRVQRRPSSIRRLAPEPLESANNSQLIFVALAVVGGLLLLGIFLAQ